MTEHTQDLMRDLGTMWRELSANDKEKYAAKALSSEAPGTPAEGACVLAFVLERCLET